mmetsp:Transcript_27118/g.60275  ORF Transcript_27118/g.60275 Transcript_27118/m.60275 type:complete len:543 (+) Transcript_27118:305-1933(+)
MRGGRVPRSPRRPGLAVAASTVPMIGLAALLVGGYPISCSAFIVPSAHTANGNAIARNNNIPVVNQRQSATAGKGVLGRTRAPMLTRLFMDMKPLATEGDWSAYLDDDTTGLIYYFNGKTGESVWEPPTKTFPSVKMTRRQEQIMKQKRTEYESSLQQEDGKSGGGFFASLLGGSGDETANDGASDEIAAKEETTFAEEVMKAPKGGFGSFFASARKESSSAGGIIEEAIVDEGAFAGSFKEDKSATVAAATAKEPSPVVEEDVSAPAAAPPKKGFALADIFKAKPKDADIIIPSETPIKIEVASKVLPSPEKASWGGEDAVFTKGRTFGVFDGVSGAEKEAGLALYSFTLASQIKGLIGTDGLTLAEMTDVLETAADIASMEATGASTATLASIGEDDILRVLTLGDCSVLVYRDGKVAAKSKEITHYFDCPYQFAEDSPDRAKDATKLTFPVQSGDIVVAGSDGIFDNLTSDQIWEQISSVPPRAGMIAGKVINQSRTVSLDEEAPTPYAKQAQRNRYEKYKSGLGGKVDDISCVVVRCL